ncbi:MAG: hypothetical protein JNN28_15640 [Saprospiraceae bacterium]|nr:hypothetical protein [Saprospiraceae bacterium]
MKNKVFAFTAAILLSAGIAFAFVGTGSDSCCVPQDCCETAANQSCCDDQPCCDIPCCAE